jgi:hypothetical protein
MFVRCASAIAGSVVWLQAANSPTPPATRPDLPGQEIEMALQDLGAEARRFQGRAGEARQFTWWLPPQADAYVLPVSAGVYVRTADATAIRWLREGSPWDLRELPLLGARYGERTLVLIVPWPHYAELVFDERVGVRFSFPEGRNNTTPCDVVAHWAGPEPLEVARAFREWRRNAPDLGAIPRPRPLARKAADLPLTAQLFGAPHFYLWGPAMFSRHDVERRKWIPLARALRIAPKASVRGTLYSILPEGDRKAVDELAGAEWPMPYLTLSIAHGLERALRDPRLLGLPAETEKREVIEKNRGALARELGEFVQPPGTWGDGPSVTLVEELHQAGLEPALLVLSDLYGDAIRPDVTQRARELGYVVGPYDSYHSVHSPDAHSDQTWETAQFDAKAYRDGRIVKAQGERQGGFKGRGFHLAPSAAWPYVQKRVGTIQANHAYSAWFVDCDATAECFDDFNPLHAATRVDDVIARRARLGWLESNHRLLVGSEGGSALFADVIHFGHGPHTPYLGHLAAAFRDDKSPHFLGRHWPSDTPDISFKPVPVPPSLRSPYFDPGVRIPLYRAALGDEVIVSHHWSFDSLKLSDVETTRALMEILYMVPPMYHLNREAWPERRAKVLPHVAFWSPLHRQLATAPLTRLEYLTDDRMVQRTTFEPPSGAVTITVNFSARPQAGLAPLSATVGGAIAVPRTTYVRTRN